MSSWTASKRLYSACEKKLVKSAISGSGINAINVNSQLSANITSSTMLTINNVSMPTSTPGPIIMRTALMSAVARLIRSPERERS